MKFTKGIGPNTDIVSYKTNPLTSGPIRMTQSVWYILIAVVATLTVIVIGIIIFLLRHNRTLKQNQGLDHHGLNLEPPRSLYSQSQNASEDLFEAHRQQPRFEPSKYSFIHASYNQFWFSHPLFFNPSIGSRVI